MNERWLEILLTPMRDQITVAETCRRYGISAELLCLPTPPLRRRGHRVGSAIAPPVDLTGTNHAGPGGRDRADTQGQPAVGRPHHSYPSGSLGLYCKVIH